MSKKPIFMHWVFLIPINKGPNVQFMIAPQVGAQRLGADGHLLLRRHASPAPIRWSNRISSRAGQRSAAGLFRCRKIGFPDIGRWQAGFPKVWYVSIPANTRVWIRFGGDPDEVPKKQKARKGVCSIVTTINHTFALKYKIGRMLKWSVSAAHSRPI